MAAAFALGAEGVQMGTRMVSAAESPVHDNWKQAIVDAAETDTVFLNRFTPPGAAGAAHRAHRRASSSTRARTRMAEFGNAPWTSTSAATWRRRSPSAVRWSGRIDAVRPVAEIIAETMAEFRDVAGVSAAYA